MSNASDQRYAWQDGEREAIAAEMAEREAAIKRDEMLAWAKSRTAARTTGEIVSRDYFPPRRREVAVGATMSDWENYIRRQIDQREKIMQKAIATVMIEQEREREKLAAELEPLRDRVATLEAALGEMRAAEKLRGTIDSIGERLDRLETRTSSGMKVVSNKSAPPFDNGAGSMIA